MKRIRTSALGVDQGDVVLFSDFEQNGLMWTGSGARQARGQIRFAEPFLEPPSVRVGLTMFDMSNGSNLRADVQAEDVTETGFAIVFRTWSDSKIARVRVGWQAIGPIRDEDDWDVG